VARSFLCRHEIVGLAQTMPAEKRRQAAAH